MFTGNRGVTTPQNQGSPANAGTPNTVIAAIKAELVFVEYYDGSGRLVQDVVLKAGDSYYSPPNSIAWTSDLKPLRSWVVDGIRQKMPVDRVEVKDDVTIMVG